MKLIDTRATESAPSSLFLTRAEFRELYPFRLNSRMNYIFKHEQPKEVPDGEGKLLLKKYSHIIRWDKEIAKLAEVPLTDRHKELGEMKYNDLKRYGSSIGLTFNELRVKAPVLINVVRNKEIELKGIEESK